ncbi:MAG: TIGR02281 family clan AA aspartic protease [Sphingomonadales bacterium]|nr:TIGR02281 family clan AA aspartic protease [Sphingomonadales bacterium]
MMRLILGAAAAIVAIVLLVSPRTDRTPDRAPPPTAAGSGTDPQRSAPQESGGEATIARAPTGHFSAPGSVNGAAVTMIADSGASLVVLDRDDAIAAGISIFPQEFTGTARTAGGQVRTKPVLLDSVVFAGIERRNVPGAVIDGDLPMVLLGQSFLSRLSDVSVSGDTMRLR